jgi:hypothetical protein
MGDLMPTSKVSPRMLLSTAIDHRDKLILRIARSISSTNQRTEGLVILIIESGSQPSKYKLAPLAGVEFSKSIKILLSVDFFDRQCQAIGNKRL